MNKSAIISTLVFLFATPVVAQEAPNSHTLDEQLRNVQAGKPAVPMAASSKSKTTAHTSQTAMVTPANPSSGKSHKASPLEPTPAVVTPATTTAYDKNGQPINSLGNGAIPALPLQEMISGDIHFITGGVGDEEVDQLKSIESQFNFHLLVTAGSGEYLSGCTLRLRDASNTDVLATGGAGPYFYARLKPGSYTLTVTTSQGAEQTVPVKIAPNTTLKKTVQFNV